MTSILGAGPSARYQRQLAIPGWGKRAQRRLEAATVFVAGAGGLGAPVCLYLAAAGVGRLIVCDDDVVELSNLNRQLLHPTSALGRSKVASAVATLERVNPHTQVLACRQRIDEHNADALVADAHVLVDCLDNFETRYLLNDVAIRKGVPLVYGSVAGLEGRLSFIHVPETACLRCIFPAAAPPGVTPVVGATPGVVGALQAMEVLKFLCRLGTNLKGRLLAWDGGTMSFQTLRTQRDPACPACATALHGRAGTDPPAVEALGRFTRQPPAMAVRMVRASPRPTSVASPRKKRTSFSPR